MILLREILSEYTDEEKDKMGIPRNAVASGGKWYVGDKYIGRVINQKFVHVSQDTTVQANNDREASDTKSNTPSDSSIMAQKLGGQQGSNVGGIYVGSDGVTRYVKKYKSSEQPIGEQLANVIYNSLGIKAPNSLIYDDGKQITYASEMIPDTRQLGYQYTQDQARAVLDGFVTDVLVGNWDVVGLENDNILFQQGSTEPIRIDNGAAFLTRARGAPKPESLLHRITEFEGFTDPDINPQYAQVFDTANYSKEEWATEIKRQIQQITDLVNKFGSWDNFAQRFAGQHLANVPQETYQPTMATIVAMLKSRTELLQQLASKL
jgi:hypothetical protein